MQQKQPSIVRFLHIPKTAGTSVNGFLGSIYGSDEIFDFSGCVNQDLIRLRKLPTDRRARLKLFRGHAPLRTGENDVDNARTFTILRDPVRRVISFCRHVAAGKSEYLVSSFPPERFNLGEFLNSGCEELNNFQSRMLLGDGDYAPPDFSREAPQNLFIRATSALEQLSFVGIQENFEESMVLLGRAFGWKIAFSKKKLNETGSSLPFAAEHIERVRELNQLDTLVYRRASAAFQRLVRKHRVALIFDFYRLRLRRSWHAAKWKTSVRLHGFCKNP